MSSDQHNYSSSRAEKGRLEVQQEGGGWKDAGSIDLLPEDHHHHTNPSPSKQDTRATATPAAVVQERELPPAFLALLSSPDDGRRHWSYRHAPDNVDTNLLILLHGSGDTHLPFDHLARTMALPQTACLSLSAAVSLRDFVTIPFDLGHTWFEEVDYRETGLPLPYDHPRRVHSLRRAVGGFRKILDSLLLVPPNADADAQERTTTSSSPGWIPERIFVFGFGCGGSLIMETLFDDLVYNHTTLFGTRKRQSKKTTPPLLRRPLGGAICVAGGIRPIKQTNKDRESTPTRRPTDAVALRTTDRTATPCLLLVGSQDDAFSPAHADAARTHYNQAALACSSQMKSDTSRGSSSDAVTIHVQKGKRNGMISSAGEMRAVMTFLSAKLVRRSLVGLS